MTKSQKYLFYRSFPHFILGLLQKYLRVEVEGLENFPERGGAILLPNHSGFIGLDALLLSYWICKNRGRFPRVLLHKFWFMNKRMETLARSLGFLEASYENGISTLEKNQLLILFPEAEQGNFKPTKNRYQLQYFKRGFVKMAVKTRSPVVPVLIIGSEETNLNFGQVRLLNQLLPLPVNYFPLPAKWKIKFLPPINFSEIDEAPEKKIQDEMALQVRTNMQQALQGELEQRKYIYFEQRA